MMACLYLDCDTAADTGVIFRTFVAALQLIYLNASRSRGKFMEIRGNVRARTRRIVAKFHRGILIL